MNIENVTVSITDVIDSLSSNKANFDKPDYVWRNELLSLGLVEKDKCLLFLVRLHRWLLY